MRKNTATKLDTGRYMYRVYLIENLSNYNERTGKGLWLISDPTDKQQGRGPVDAADSLKEAKELIDSWYS